MFKIVFIVFLMLNIVTTVNASQIVGGIQIDFEPKFVEDTQASKDLLSNTPQNVRQAILALNIFVGNAPKGISGIRLVNTRYVPEVTVSLDGATTESIRRVSNLDGIKNFKKTIHSKVVSGYESRRISITANRWGAIIGGEFLLIYNHRLNTISQLTVIFTKELDLSLFVKELSKEEDLVDPFSLDTEREYANKLLSSVQVVL